MRLCDILIEFGDETLPSGSVALAAFGHHSTIRSRLAVEALRGLTSLFSLSRFGVGAPRM